MRSSSDRVIYRIISDHSCCCASDDEMSFYNGSSTLIENVWLRQFYTALIAGGVAGVMGSIRVGAKKIK